MTVMTLRRRVAFAWAAALAVSLAGGCTALVGQFNVVGGDGGAGDATADQGSGDGGTEGSSVDTGVVGDTGPHGDGSSSCGTDCSEAGSCVVSTVTCNGGTPACTQTGTAPNGKTCGADLFCSNGSCKACTSGAACVPTSKPCNAGSAECADGGLTCKDLGTPAKAGTSCGTNEVCDGNGTCAACTTGSMCNPPGNTCQTGTMSCTSGPSCTNLTNVTAGTSCGTSKVCDGKGSCVAVCTPANCAGGCCDPTTQACTLYASQTSATCGHAGAQCHSCAVGSSTGSSAPACSTTNGTCAGTLAGQIGTYSDVTSIDSDGTYVYFVDQSNSQVAEVSAYSLGQPVLLSAQLGGLADVIYDATSNVAVFSQQADATHTALYKATPNVANSATKFATVAGTPASPGLAMSGLEVFDVVTITASNTFTPNNCTIAGSCSSLNSIATSILSGVTWPPNQTAAYFADYTNGQILTWVPSCGCYNKFATTTAPGEPMNDGTYIYWLQGTGTLQIQRQAISGAIGSAQNLGVYGDNNQVINLSTDGKYLYWQATLGGVDGIYYMPIAGGTAQLLATAGGYIDPVKVVKEKTTGQWVVFWGDTGTAALMKVISPP